LSLCMFMHDGTRIQLDATRTEHLAACPQKLSILCS